MTFVPVRWPCKEHTAVSHSSTEVEVISLDAGLRLYGNLASGLWEHAIDVLEPQAQCNLTRHPKKKLQMSKNNGVNQLMEDLASLFIFEDNNAVLKMTIKGRSPTMRHVSPTHRVDVDWLFDGIHLDPGITIKYVNTPINRLLTV